MGADEQPQEDAARQRLGRAYRASRIPVIRARPDGPGTERDVLLAVYAEICASWRALTEVRFKLLALLPPVAGIGLFATVSSSGPFAGSGLATRVAAAVFGLLVSLGLVVYDQRNSHLYNDLISRGRRAEQELGVDTGIFLGRRGPARGSVVRHGLATGLVYWTVIGSWALAIVLILSEPR